MKEEKKKKRAFFKEAFILSCNEERKKAIYVCYCWVGTEKRMTDKVQKQT